MSTHVVSHTRNFPLDHGIKVIIIIIITIIIINIMHSESLLQFILIKLKLIPLNTMIMVYYI